MRQTKGFFGGVEENRTPVRRTSRKDIYSLEPFLIWHLGEERNKIPTRGLRFSTFVSAKQTLSVFL